MEGREITGKALAQTGQRQGSKAVKPQAPVPVMPGQQLGQVRALRCVAASARQAAARQRWCVGLSARPGTPENSDLPL